MYATRNVNLLRVPLGWERLAPTRMSREEDVELVDARVVYGTLGPNTRQPMLVPAYELESLDGSRIGRTLKSRIAGPRFQC